MANVQNKTNTGFSPNNTRMIGYSGAHIQGPLLYCIPGGGCPAVHADHALVDWRDLNECAIPPAPPMANLAQNLGVRRETR